MLKANDILEKLTKFDTTMINEGSVFNASFDDIPKKLKDLFFRTGIIKESVVKVSVTKTTVAIVTTRTNYTASLIKILLKKLSLISVSVDNDGDPALMLIFDI